jgi:hypothetical protein
MFGFGPSQDFSSASRLFSGCTSSQLFAEMCIGEQRGGAAEILTRTGVEHGEHTQSTDFERSCNTRPKVTFSTLASIATVCNVVLFGCMIMPVATSFNLPPGAQ